MPTTSPDNIYYADGTTLASLADITSAMATSVQDALNLREAHNFTFANDTAKSAATGMVEGDIGYQTDTAVFYIYNGSVWRTWAKLETAYTPTFTNFTASASNFIYSIAGGVCTVTGTVTVTAVTGAMVISLPINVNSSYLSLTVSGNTVGVGFGSGTAYNGTTAYSMLVAPFSTSSVMLRAQNAASTYLSFVSTSSTIPMTWASGNKFGISISYPVA